MSPSTSPNSKIGQVENAKRVLCNTPHFAELPFEIQNALASVAIPRHFAEGQVIFIEGEPADYLYILESGWVKASRMSPEGREQAMLVVKPGEIFGDVALFTDTPYPGTVVALEPTKAWAIGKSDILELIARYPELALAAIRSLGQRILYYIGLVEDLSLRNVEARLANTLLKNAEQSKGHLLVRRRKWATFDTMANRLGTVRDVLSRALRSLEEDGLIRVEKHAIIILDSEGLAQRGTPNQ
jgi:CRP/FNR family transcriptional regulator, dissimilatory nitrate respiration regulator